VADDRDNKLNQSLKLDLLTLSLNPTRTSKYNLSVDVEQAAGLFRVLTLVWLSTLSTHSTNQHN